MIYFFIRLSDYLNRSPLTNLYPTLTALLTYCLFQKVKLCFVYHTIFNMFKLHLKKTLKTRHWVEPQVRNVHSVSIFNRKLSLLGALKTSFFGFLNNFSETQKRTKTIIITTLLLNLIIYPPPPNKTYSKLCAYAPSICVGSHIIYFRNLNNFSK